MLRIGSSMILLVLLLLNVNSTKPENLYISEYRLPVINFEKFLIKESSIWKEFSDENPGMHNIQAIEPAITQIVKFMAKEPHIRIEIRGHCSDIEWTKIGESLCFNRAYFIREKLIDEGIAETRLEINASNQFVLSSYLESVEEIKNLEEGRFKSEMQQLHQSVSFMTIN